MNFFKELKRRNVFRVGIAYLVAAWFLIQIADTFVPIIGLPEWVPRLIFFFLVIGLVPTLIAAWALCTALGAARLPRHLRFPLFLAPAFAVC